MKNNILEFNVYIFTLIVIIMSLIVDCFVYGLLAMLLRIFLNIFVIFGSFKIIVSTIKIRKKDANQIALIIFCVFFSTICIFMLKNYVLDLFVYNKEEIITSSYNVDEYVHKYCKDTFNFREGSHSYKLRIMDVNRDLKINSSLYSKLKKYDGKIKVVFWKKSGIIDSIEFIEEE